MIRRRGQVSLLAFIISSSLCTNEPKLLTASHKIYRKNWPFDEAFSSADSFDNGLVGRE